MGSRSRAMHEQPQPADRQAVLPGSNSQSRPVADVGWLLTSNIFARVLMFILALHDVHQEHGRT